ncbi:Putative serine protease K12H4.7 [Frankliniella fusca]|uniref:Serine protease K12H4.7 n=1 Tax=Frankliniella fusca TaxID=407009 RepID=A0AAE1HKR4_9NEOP|nr:Putative serine protease K12H4.7 [Frankliniella fusca]
MPARHLLLLLLLQGTSLLGAQPPVLQSRPAPAALGPWDSPVQPQPQSTQPASGGPAAQRRALLRAAVGATPFSYSLWLRTTHPRLMDGEDEASSEPSPVTRGSVQQPLDHEDPQNEASWTQVYWRNAEHYKEGGPAFVMLSGTADYVSDWLRRGQMADLARTYGADCYFLTTRFFDLVDHPTPDTSLESLDYLSVEQILLDVSSFLEQLDLHGTHRKVVLFGAGFGGAIATWARQRFPTMVSGVVASGATLQALYDTYSYFPVVSDAIDWYHRKDMDCLQYVQRAFNLLNQALLTKSGRADFNKYFQPCSPIDEEQSLAPEDRAHVLGLVAGVLADQVQDDRDGPLANGRPGNDKLWPYCYALSNAPDSLLVELARLINFSVDGHCLEASYQGLVDSLSSSDWGSEANLRGIRPWLWLQCTELGQLPTTSGNLYKFPYSTSIGMSSFYRKLCRSVFGDEATSHLFDSISQLNNIYGGKKPQISNAIFVTGDLDPWKDLSPEQGLSGEEVYVFSVLRASHAHDMFPRDDYDPPWMKKTRKAIASVLNQWLK